MKKNTEQFLPFVEILPSELLFHATELFRSLILLHILQIALKNTKITIRFQ